MSEYYSVVGSPEYLEHHGILGMKWGVRRYQNPDGSLTEEGRRRYGDILTKDQMNNYIKSFNLRTGKKKTINKNTIFKTPNGTYDYKGRRINTDTVVIDPSKESDKKTSVKKVSDMTDAELKAANDRMNDEIIYKKRYAELHPAKTTLAQQVLEGTKDAIVNEIPKAVGRGIGKYIENLIGEAGKSSGGDDDGNKKKKEQNDSNKTKEQSGNKNDQRNNGKTTGENKPKVEPAKNLVRTLAEETVESAPKLIKEVPKESAKPKNNSNAMSMFGQRIADIPDAPAGNVRSLFTTSTPSGKGISLIDNNVYDTKVKQMVYDSTFYEDLFDEFYHSMIRKIKLSEIL